MYLTYNIPYQYNRRVPDTAAKSTLSHATVERKIPTCKKADVETTKARPERHIEAEDICHNKNAKSGGSRYMLIL